MTQSPVREKSYLLALEVVKFCRSAEMRREPILARQLLRAGTSAGANAEESAAAQSRKDFVSKLAIARKEARECRYWLRLVSDAGIVAPKRAAPLISRTEEVIRLLTSIILTTEHPREPTRHS